MDSLTQAVLGATVGEVVLGRKVGNKAPLWGAVAGTLPDLDVVLNYVVNDVQSTVWHRTFSHSLFVLTLAAPVFGYLVYQIHKKKTDASFRDWTWLFFWGLITHPLLDAFTNYGTMLLYPFGNERISWRTIFIIDPIYTLPLLIATIAVLFMSKSSGRRRLTAVVALAVSSTYLAITCLVKLHVNQVVETNLQEQQIPYQKFMTTSNFFNTLLWSTVVKSEEGYHVGYYSLLDDDRQMTFKYLPQNESLLQPYLEAAGEETKEQLRDLIDFTEYYYAMEEADEGIHLYDLRFGTVSGWFEIGQDFIFTFHIFRQAGEVVVERASSEFQLKEEDVQRLLERTKGN